MTHLLPCEISEFVSVQVADVAMFWWFLHKELNVDWAVVGMRDIDNLGINWPRKTFLHSEVEGLDGDEPGHDVHRNAQVFYTGKTITDVHDEHISALEEGRWDDQASAPLLDPMFNFSTKEQNLDKHGHIKDAALVDVLLGEGVDVIEDRRGRGVWTVGQFDHMTMVWRAPDGEYHFRRQNIRLLHLKKGWNYSEESGVHYQRTALNSA